jgi:hypothetical protein
LKKSFVRETIRTVFSNSRVTSSPISVRRLFRRVASSVEAEVEGSVGVDEGSLAQGGLKDGGGGGKEERTKFIKSRFFVLSSSSDKDHVRTQRMVA